MQHSRFFGLAALLSLMGLAAGGCGGQEDGDDDEGVLGGAEANELGTLAAPLPGPGCRTRCDEAYAAAIEECNGADGLCLCLAADEHRCCLNTCSGRRCIRTACWP